MLLGSAGLGSGWLITLAWFAAPYRIFLLVAAGILLVGGVGAFLWKRRVTDCAVRTSPAGWVAGAMLIGFLLVGGALFLFGYLHA